MAPTQVPSGAMALLCASALLNHGWASVWEYATILSSLFFFLPRANIRVGAHVCGRNCPHSSSGCLGNTQPTGHRHWHPGCPGKQTLPCGELEVGVGVDVHIWAGRRSKSLFLFPFISYRCWAWSLCWAQLPCGHCFWLSPCSLLSCNWFCCPSVLRALDTSTSSGTWKGLPERVSPHLVSSPGPYLHPILLVMGGGAPLRLHKA